MTARLAVLRIEIDECDRQIAELLARRSRAVAAVADEKTTTAQPTRDRVREAAVIDGVFARMKACDGRYDRHTVNRIWTSIFDGCESLQASLSRPVDDGDRGNTRL